MIQKEQITLNQYVPPAMTVVELKAEQGFAASEPMGNIAFDELYLGDIEDGLESRSNAGYFGGSSDVWY